LAFGGGERGVRLSYRVWSRRIELLLGGGGPNGLEGLQREGMGYCQAAFDEDRLGSVLVAGLGEVNLELSGGYVSDHELSVCFDRAEPYALP
jgi:hypothetical protein